MENDTNKSFSHGLQIENERKKKLEANPSNHFVKFVLQVKNICKFYVNFMSFIILKKKFLLQKFVAVNCIKQK